MVNDFNIVLQDKLHETFRYTIKLLEDNNLRYWTCGGTTLGAVRHNDIIPWDDDIDIYMPREDYDKLIQNRKQLCKGKYEIFDLGDPGYISPYAKLVDMTTTWVEKKSAPCVLGVFIDIFPLDYFDCNPDIITKEQKIASRLFYQYYDSLSKYDFSHYYKLAVNLHLRSLFYVIKAKFLGVERSLFLLKKQINKMANIKGSTYCVCNTQWVGRIFDAKWFNSYTECLFHNYNVRNPQNASQYLEMLYGDYMKLPEEEKRISQHNQYYINLKEHLSFEEIEKQLKEGSSHIVY